MYRDTVFGPNTTCRHAKETRCPGVPLVYRLPCVRTSYMRSAPASNIGTLPPHTPHTDASSKHSLPTHLPRPPHTPHTAHTHVGDEGQHAVRAPLLAHVQQRHLLQREGRQLPQHLPQPARPCKVHIGIWRLCQKRPTRWSNPLIAMLSRTVQLGVGRALSGSPAHSWPPCFPSAFTASVHLHLLLCHNPDVLLGRDSARCLHTRWISKGRDSTG